ncbi:MAG: alpha/beta hydrolase, partial [Psychrobacter alimentarius]
SLFYESGNAVWRFDSRSWIGEIETPTMVIIPTVDQVVPARTQRDLAARVGAERIVEIEGAGHESILSRPEVYVEAIAGFLLGSGSGVAE